MRPLDPFDLPDWLGTGEVTWRSRDGLRTGSLVGGRLEHGSDLGIACDLLAVDDAYPTAVAPDAVRLAAHQAWRHGEIHLVDRDGTLTLAVPGTGFTAALVLDAVERLARAVGAPPEHYAVLLRIGG